MHRRRFQLPLRRKTVVDPTKAVIQLPSGELPPALQPQENILDINKITLPQLPVADIYLGAIVDVAEHIKKHHADKTVTIINLYAIGDDNPLKAEPQSIKTDCVYSFKPAPSSKYDKQRIDIIHQSVPSDGVVHDVINVYVRDLNGVPIHLIFNHLAETSKLSVDLGMPVYFACQRGISRSPTALLAMMVKHLSFDSFDEAFTLVKSQRDKIDPKLTFIIDLQGYFKQLVALREATVLSRAPAIIVAHAFSPAAGAATSRADDVDAIGSERVAIPSSP